MKAEIIAVGTELLLGDVVNTNATWLSKELAALGIDVYYHTVVGDNPKRIQDILLKAIERSNILIFTGGLGPTEDDLTIATLADFFRTQLISDPQSEETIRNFFIARDMPMSATNLKQALKPEGAQTIANPVGTAPGIFWDVTEKTGKPVFILTFPGVPKELYAMWPTGKACLQETLKAHNVRSQVFSACFLKFLGIGESKLGEMLRDLMETANPTVAPYVGNAEVKIRIVAKAPTEAEAQTLIEPVKQEILKRCGQYYYGENEETLEEAVGKLLKQKGLTVSTAESCTGGLLSSRLTDVPGSSDYIKLNAITYSNDQKTALLQVNPETLAAHGAVSAETAAEMADGIRQVSGCSIGLSTTGIAGPDGGSAEKPVGLVYLGFSGLHDGPPLTRKVMVNPKYSRTDIKYWFTQYALNFLRLYILGILEPEAPENATAGAEPAKIPAKS